METVGTIRPIKEIFQKQKIDLPNEAGVYAFWWIAQKSELLDSNRRIILKGPNQLPVQIQYGDWWATNTPYPCLYVGKSTNIKKRFSLHIKRGSPGRLHKINPNNTKTKPVTTSCQLRHGIEHIYPEESDPLDIILKSVGFSYNTKFGENATAERFFEEDRLIGHLRPWFNIDSER